MRKHPHPGLRTSLTGSPVRLTSPGHRPPYPLPCAPHCHKEAECSAPPRCGRRARTRPPPRVRKVLFRRLKDPHHAAGLHLELVRL